MATVTGRKRKVNENVDNTVNNNDENAAQDDSDVDFLTSEVQNEDGDTSDDDSSVYSGMEDDEESDEDEDEEEEEGEDEDENDDEGEQADEEEEERSSKNEKLKSTVNDRKNINETNISNTGLPAPPEQDEYMEDSSDEEDLRNTVGNIPMNWYEDYPHLGYDLDGKPILKPKRGDELDNFLRRMEDPDTWRTVFDPQTGQDVVLSDADVDAIKRIMSGNVPDKNFDPYAPWVDWFSSEVMDTPVTGRPEHKRSFVPSRIEAIKVGRMVHAIKMGWMKPGQKKTKEDERKYYLMWDADDKADDVRRIESHIPAPKPRLPGHAESYNPPPEYLFTEEEMKRWESLEDEPWKRRYPFLPRKYSSLRAVPGYGRFGRERFERCLDLYLCPRAKKMRLTIQPEDLVPQLPKPRDLQPFPTVCSLIFKGHKGLIRSITSDPSGQFLASGSDDQTIKVWEIQTGRCLKTFEVGGVVRCIAWCPNTALALLAAAVDQQVLLLNPGVGDRLVQAKTDEILKESPDQGDYVPPERVKAVVTWEKTTKKQWEAGIRVVVSHFKQVKQVSWHAKGDYFATVMPEGAHRSVLIHQLSKRRSQVPFTKAKGLVQCAIFHPIRPYLFVATQRHVRIYNLMKQELSKKLMTGAKWVSSLAVHPGGDNVLVGTYDRKVQWFDLDLSTKPYQGSRHHHKAVRAVAYHRRYPLFASASDDCTAIVSHGMVYNDLLQNPTIVPLKVLRGHQQEDDLGILDVYFHPTQPWLFTAGADATIRLYT